MYDKFERACLIARNGSPEFDNFMLIAFGSHLQRT
jgi:hypothetical protein